MADADLAAIRAARMAEMKAAQGGPRQEKPQGEDDAKEAMLSRILDNAARERLNRISIVKKEKAVAVEQLLMRMLQTGQIQGRVTENQLIQLLEQIPSQSETKIKFNRRNYSDDEDEFDF